MKKRRKKIGIGEHENDSSIPMIVFNSSLCSLSGLVKIVTVTGTTSSAGNLNLQLDLSVKVISAICRDNTNYSCKLHVNTDKTSWMAYVHDYTNNNAISNRNVTVYVYYIE